MLAEHQFMQRPGSRRPVPALTPPQLRHPAL